MSTAVLLAPVRGSTRVTLRPLFSVTQIIPSGPQAISYGSASPVVRTSPETICPPSPDAEPATAAPPHATATERTRACTPVSAVQVRFMPTQPFDRENAAGAHGGSRS